MFQRSKKIAAGLVLASMLAGSAIAGTINIHNGGDPTSLDPHKVSGDWENRIVGDIFEGLVTEDRAAEPIPGQAESWTVSDDGLAALTNSHRLYSLGLKGTGITDDAMSQIGDSIIKLALSHTRVTDAGVQTLANKNELQILELARKLAGCGHLLQRRLRPLGVVRRFGKACVWLKLETDLNNVGTR